MPLLMILLLLALVAVDGCGVLALCKLLAAAGALPKSPPRGRTRHLSTHRRAMDAYKTKGRA